MTLEKKINKKGEVSYLARIYLGEDETGKKIRVSKTFTPTLTETGKVRTEKSAIEEVTALAQEWERGVIGGDITLGKAMSCQELFLEWKAIRHPNLAGKTAFDYERLWNTKVKPIIGHIKTDSINVGIIDKMYAKLSKSNKKTGGSYDIDPLHRMLRAMFNWGISKGYIKKNPCEYADRPKVPKIQQAFLEPSQMIMLLSNLESQTLEFQAYLSILITTGCRRGEVIALKWSDISADGILTIQRACSYVVGQGLIIKETKTGTVRRIALPNTVIQLLRDYKEEQSIINASYGDLYEEQGFMFTQTSGMCKHPDSLKVPFKQYLRYCGFDDETVARVHIHTLRHSTASLMLANNIDIRTVAGTLGHSQPTLTLTLYGHFLDSQAGAAKSTFEPMLEQARIAR